MPPVACLLVLLVFWGAHAELFSNSSRVAVIGDATVEWGRLHNDGFVLRLEHALRHYHAGAKVRGFSLVAPRDSSSDETVTEAFYRDVFPSVMEDFRPTDVVAFFGVSDTLRLLDLHPDTSSIKGLNSGINLGGDARIGTLVNEYRRFLQAMAIEAHSSGATFWICTPSIVGEDVFGDMTPAQHVLELLAGAARDVASLVLSPHFPHAVHLHITPDHPDAAAANMREKKKRVDGEAQPKPRGVLIDTHMALLNRLEELYQTARLRHGSRRLTLDGVELNVNGHALVADVLINGLRVSASAGDATQNSSPPEFKARLAHVHVRRPEDVYEEAVPVPVPEPEPEPEPVPEVEPEGKAVPEGGVFFTEDELALLDEL